ncbi:DUF4325 domain-containing protein [Glaesserella parasuis]|uniref:STAS-like domain-containing protein n=1 Tax=Glaesserella parasuis TaxID=738 RepID=A0A6L7B1Z2_GLAPU|nr:DUF4325 domain-containing protein [Glaesserella parasuis]MCT8631654.1 STAS-like domain-containing protein [Glaesserella parasuis]MCT8635708.1 STAS-like domain-containing protein [Glaesserella parasuis]MCT8637691.1 STAS-like domain-containing protein [Glaesserella parasuis]MCT8643741.1 STAS-like domain-containing protein [Glaesserella parasuis]MCT8645704.1 STAS-like domain-containing protein [Glaesserella parasuis]
MQKLNVRDFTLFPGPRYIKLGEYSGEWFREEILIPSIKIDSDIIIDLDGVAGYGSSFLEEAFGGSVRKGVDTEILFNIINKLVSNDDPDLVEEIRDYVNDAIKVKVKANAN